MLEKLFNPKSVAIIGASAKELSIGNVITKNLLHFDFKGSVYPINPNAGEIRGLKAYPTIFDVPGDIDLAHIVIPPPYVPQAVEDCGKKGIKAIIINTAGFKEMGAEGEALETRIVENAKKYGIRIIGPNCQGIINTDPEIKAYCDFTFTFPKPGYISIVAQSGGVGAIIMQNLFDLDIGMRMYASNGNACDISIPEIIEYYGNDEKTRVILLYVETLPAPREFMEVAKKVAAKKPILAMNAGTTEEGSKAATSHTGGLAGGIVTDLIFKKTGIVSFKSAEEMCQAAVTFASQHIPKGNRVGMITNTGGPAIIATDELIRGGLKMPPLSEKAKSILKQTMLPVASINNPIDVVATAGPTQFRSAVDVMMNEEQIDSVYIVFVTAPFSDCEGISKELSIINQQNKKPIVCNYITNKSLWVETTKIMKEGGIPCYDFPETAAKALASLTRYHKLSARITGYVKKFNDVNKKKVEEIITKAKESSTKILSATDVYQILSAYNIPVADWHIAVNVDEAIEAAKQIGFPIVIKADSEKIIHKSDAGGVAINLRDSKSVRTNIEKMLKKFDNKDLRFFIQKFMPGGRELIIGAKAEEGLGHLVMFGLGGIFVEVFKDVVFNIAPVTGTEAQEMLTSIVAAPLIKGVRGEKGICEKCVTDIIQRISQLVTDLPEIKEMDMNPVIAYEDKVCIVDARIII